ILPAFSTTLHIKRIFHSIVPSPSPSLHEEDRLWYKPGATETQEVLAVRRQDDGGYELSVMLKKNSSTYNK
ncbi:hypothetical protein V2J09_000899, partial [Rumex salicifolius]